MKLRLLSFWDKLNSSFWFVPGLMLAAAIALSYGTLVLDWSARQRWIQQTGWIWGGSADGAREILSTIAGSMVTVAGVVFSITMVVLTLASSQFGPRLLRNFMRDTGTQVVLGTFVSTFIYCLLILRTIRGEEDGFVPNISVTLGIIFAVASLAVLIYFIHHVSNSIQVPILIARVGAELDSGIDRLFPGEAGNAPNGGGAELPQDFAAGAGRLPAARTGYLQVIDMERLVELAQENDLIIKLQHAPGSFVTEGNDLALVYPQPRFDEALAKKVQGVFLFGPERSESQDVEYSVYQLVEIAVRALSPGINDPFTAITCIDRLGAALCRFAERETPSPCRFDDQGKLRLLAVRVTFAGLADAAVQPIRLYGCSSYLIGAHLLKILTRVASHVRRPEDFAVLADLAAVIENASRNALSEEFDRQRIDARYWEFLQTLRQLKQEQRGESPSSNGAAQGSPSPSTTV